MMVTLEEMNFDTQMVATSGNITIDIPDYDPVAGWYAGPNYVYNGIISVNFATMP
ncbi:MAG: hypothetical protein LBG59_10105 [Candidatus Peribacteria bacterium]|nr:hypothetical protein [Candidatus Peribacteria bacterium]